MRRGRSHTEEEVSARRRDVETLVAAGGWTSANVARIASKHAVSVSQIYRDRQAVVEELRAVLVPTDQVEAKVDLLVRARALYRLCLQEHHTGTAARLLDFEARVVGAHEPIRVEVAHTESMNDLELARTILDPEAMAWARARLTEAGLPVYGVLDLPVDEVAASDDQT
jgi:hypothetical protein